MKISDKDTQDLIYAATQGSIAISDLLYSTTNNKQRAIASLYRLQKILDTIYEKNNT